MLSRLFRKLMAVLNITLITTLVIISISFTYWFTLQSQASSNDVNPIVSFKSTKTRVPDIGTGVTDSLPNINIANKTTSNMIINRSNFIDTSCSNPKKNTPSNTQESEIKLSQNGIFGVSRSEIVFKGIYQKTAFYGQSNLNQDLIDYILCVIDITADQASTKLQLQISPNNDSHLNRPTRIIIYDDIDEFGRFYREAYGDKLGESTPWGLSEKDTVSTFLRLENDSRVTPEEFKDIRYRLTYNISHEYFHNLFLQVRRGYTPFIEEGLAVFIAGDVTEKVLGFDMSCEYKISQVSYAKNRTVNLSSFDMTTKPSQWYKLNNSNELYALSYYFMKDMDNQGKLTNFVDKFLHNLDFDNSDLANFTPEFKSNLDRMIDDDDRNCSYIKSLEPYKS